MREIRVLVVDDHHDCAYSLARLLCFDGFETREACSYRQAIETAAQWNPDAACIDLFLDEADGYSLRTELTRVCHPAPIAIALTGRPGDELALRSAREGFVAHLLKPYDPVFVAQLLRAYVSSGSPSMHAS